MKNGLFKIFKRRRDDGPKYTVRTESIIPLLEESSSKFKSLSDMIMQQSETDAALSTTPDAIKKLYTAAAHNMMLVTTVLDPIVVNMRLRPTMDIRSISCDLMQIGTLLRDVTVPNIKLMAKLLYTKSNDAQTKYMIDQYTDTSFTTSSSAALATTSRNDGSTCSPRDTPTELAEDGFPVAAPVTFRSIAPVSMPPVFIPVPAPIRPPFEISIQDILAFLFDDDTVVNSPVGNIVRIILLILLIPVSVVVNIIVAILAVIFAILSIFGPIFNTDDGSGSDIIVVLIVIAVLTIIGGPVFIILEILENIREIFTNSPNSGRSTQQANKVKRHLLDVLDSPLDTIIKVLGNKNRLSDTTNEEEEEMDCEMSALKCKTDALNDILPF